MIDLIEKAAQIGLPKHTVTIKEKQGVEDQDSDSTEFDLKEHLK